MFEEASGVIELGPSPVWNWLLRSRVIYISTKLYTTTLTCEHGVIYLLTEVLSIKTHGAPMSCHSYESYHVLSQY